MGQQQLLLLVLTIVVVGLAIMGGIMVFQENMRKNQADDVLNRNIRIAQEAINWRARTLLHGGGGGGSFDPLAERGMAGLGIQADLGYTRHEIETASGDVLQVVGVSTVHPSIGARVRVEGNRIVHTEVSMRGEIVLPGTEPEK